MQGSALAQCHAIHLWGDDPSKFTFSINASNLSGARFDFTFPEMEDLRLEMWDECEGRMLD